MARRSNKGRFGFRGFVILIVVVLLGGAALYATDNLVSPFEYSNLLMNTPDVQEDAGFEMITLTDVATAAPPPAPTDMGHQDEGYFDFSWHELGDVLYNLWFMALVTVIVIAVARPVGWIIRRIKQPSQRIVHQQANLITQ